MSTIILEAEARKEVGKGASRRLRRLENKVPAIVYGGDKKPKTIHLSHNKLNKTLENEGIYSSILTLSVDGKEEKVILKSMQRHPYKPIILHMDLQRVSAKDVLVKQIPLHFINEQTAKGVKAGGVISHTMTQVEVRCEARNLPEFIEVDMANVDLGEIVHIADLKLPKGVKLSVDAISGDSHNLSVASIHTPKAAVSEEVEEGSTVSESGESSQDGEAKGETPN